MRQLGTLPDQEQSQRFVDYLLTEGIRTRLDHDENDCTIWVLSEDDLDRCREEFASFRENPQDTKYNNRSEAATQIRTERQQKNAQAKKNQQTVQFATPGREKLADRAKRLPVTFGLIVICCLVAFYTNMGSSFEETDRLSFVSKLNTANPDWDKSNPIDAFVDIRAGQFWRILTPIFLHFGPGPMHLLFNMMCLYSFGGQIESRKGKYKFILMVLALAIFSNLVQVLFSQHPFFGGMSGVVYGLFGFIWIKSRFDPLDRFYISQFNVMLLLGWFVFCFSPGMNVANGGHAGGLILGAAMGFVSSQMRKR